MGGTPDPMNPTESEKLRRVVFLKSTDAGGESSSVWRSKLLSLSRWALPSLCPVCDLFLTRSQHPNWVAKSRVWRMRRLQVAARRHGLAGDRPC